MLSATEISKDHPEVAKLWFDSYNADFTIEYLCWVLDNNGPYDGSYGTIMENRTGDYLGTYSNKEEAEQEIEDFTKLRDETWEQYQIAAKLIS